MNLAKREKGVVAATLGILSSVILSPTAEGQEADGPSNVPVIAGSGCGLSSPCYAIARTNGFIADGAAARLDVREYSAPDYEQGGHTNQALWVSVDNDYAGIDPEAPSDPEGDGQEWCEIGWTKGYRGDPNYKHYGAFQVNGQYDDFLLYHGIELNTSYHYQIHREYDGKYNLYINNNDMADCFADPFTLEVDVGLEYTHNSAQADAVEPRELQWRRATDLTWFDWGSLSTEWDEIETGSAARWDWVTEPTHGKNWNTN